LFLPAPEEEFPALHEQGIPSSPLNVSTLKTALPNAFFSSIRLATLVPKHAT